MHEGVSSGVKSSRSTSLQEFVPAKVTPMTKVAPTTVRREHNNKVSKFRVDIDRETENTTTLSPARKEWL